MADLNTLALAIKTAAHPLTGGSEDYDTLLQTIGDARFVLIGEASHGTHEFYRERARITRLLIEQKGFTAVAVEADWPDAYRVNRFVRGLGEDRDASEALGDFQRFPKWMWRNEDVHGFVSWLRDHNTRHADRQAGFHGIDLYSLHRSMEAVVEYLDTVDPQAAQRARQRYSCFEPYGEDPQEYGMATVYGTEEPCESEVVAQLMELRQRETELSQGGVLAEDEHFFAEQNARLALNAERYYRAVFHGREDTWNLRDAHMADTIDALFLHQKDQGLEPRIVVWAHNSHLGDARATEVNWRQNQQNVGQYVRERHPEDTFIIGLSTHHGEVTAADDWGQPAKRKTVRPALQNSVEDLLHEVGVQDFWLDLRADRNTLSALQESRLQRFIGVIYRPQTERWSHYYLTRPSDQYDALLYFDRTSALVPLDRTSGWEAGELPDTYPSGQ
ncbi:erythromycin esterase family protein [Deinococcus cellulosilyticus]|uniref:Erythromycin esterase n=1 Tax=Deinococcus cellulosilyticus (strain DSM 18568 / NBRC 106333 / KACC 11606 / 5516J-15) TaxID=1223518 RepID=A0A511N9Q8_DEIC1|nr:erythromycin esterase family protein [Deinococcus cellulosilyticus]GEM49256.1 hypothetical protein DC3_48910 [Deinococcus cellulosilyticus NBRC 106333 = KACC 11606]